MSSSSPVPEVAVGAVPSTQPDTVVKPEHINLTVTDGNVDIKFRIKYKKNFTRLMNCYCERRNLNLGAVRFLFEGQRLLDTDTPESVSNSSTTSSPPQVY
jgi:small ubiquitin-related modifier